MDQNSSPSLGLFVSFEGPEGSGKSTQARLLAEALRNAGRTVCSVREPGGTRIGEELRKILKNPEFTEITVEADLLMFCAARIQLVKEVILPAFNRGDVVIADRFCDSTTVYQEASEQLAPNTIKYLNQFATAFGLCMPSQTFVLDIPVGLMAERVHDRADAVCRFEKMSIDYHRNVRARYRRLVDAYPERVKLIDGVQSKAAIQAEIWNILFPVPAVPV